MTTRRTKATAYHEAGHAVMAYVFGRLLVVTLDPAQSEPHGHCQSQTKGVEVSNRILIALGGPVAEARGAKRRLRLILDWGRGCGDSDQARQQAEEHLRMIGLTTDVDEFIEQAIKMVKPWIRDDWPAVEALAGELLKRITIDGEAAGRIIAAAMNEPYAPKELPT